MRIYLRSVAALTGVCAGIAVGGALVTGSLPAAIGFLALAAALTVVLRTVAGTRGVPTVSAEIWFAFALRAAVAAVLYGWALTTGHQGFITGDDAGYASLAWGYAQWLHGHVVPPYVPPSWGGDGYLFGGFVYLASAAYYLFGLQPLLVDFLNAALSTATIVLWWDASRRLFSARVALVTLAVLALDPANVLFSALHLKDPLSLLAVGLVLWSTVRFALSPRLAWLVSAAIGIALMQGVRSYLTLALFAVVVFGVFVGRHVSRPARFAWLVSAAVLCGGTLAIALTAGGTSIPLPSLTSLAQIRIGMAQGAHTAFSVAQTPAPQPTSVAPPAAIASAQGEATPTAVVVLPVTMDQTPLPAMAASLAAFGLLLPAAWLAAKTRRRPTLAMALGLVTLGAGVAVAAASAWIWARPVGEAASATFAYLPTGFANVLFAPFPWALRRPLDLATVPAMLLWYVLLVAAVRTIAFANGRRWQLLPPAAFVVGVLIAFVLFEGNVGTLFRQRAMTIGPVVAFLAAPSLVAVVDRIVAVRRARQPKAGARRELAYRGG
jgi:Dolichyl-phosphate-mannose-protein mannosyltransferase